MKIGIIGAINQEIKIIKKIIYKHTEEKIGKYYVCIGKFKKIKIFLIKSGIGKVSASIAAMILINLYKPNLIINTGSAGSLSRLLNIGDIIIPKTFCYHDVDLSNFGYALGQIPNFPKKFIMKKKIYNFLKKIAVNFQFKFTTKLLITGDLFIREDSYIEKLKKNFPYAVAVEMEATAIAQVCYQFNIPFIVIKSISDLSDDNATGNFKKNISIASFQSCKFVRLILEHKYIHEII